RNGHTPPKFHPDVKFGQNWHAQGTRPPAAPRRTSPGYPAFFRCGLPELVYPPASRYPALDAYFHCYAWSTGHRQPVPPLNGGPQETAKDSVRSRHAPPPGRPTGCSLATAPPWVPGYTPVLDEPVLFQHWLAIPYAK